MNKEMVIAKVRRWQAELAEMIVTLNGEGKSGPILEVLQKRAHDLNDLIELIQDKSFIEPGDIEFQPQPVLDEIENKVKKVKEGVRKLKKLSSEKQKIIHDLEKDA
jgi:hypothetical protein